MIRLANSLTAAAEPAEGALAGSGLGGPEPEGLVDGWLMVEYSQAQNPYAKRRRPVMKRLDRFLSITIIATCRDEVLAGIRWIKQAVLRLRR